MEQVVPGSIVYSDLKPEAIINDVRLVKFYPTSNVNGQLPSDVIRFELRGNGYFDPFSAYVYFEIELPILAAASNDKVSAKLLDDSAHSLINRLVLRSEGTELERLENYDVLAKMLNDVTYTNEMRLANHVQGMGVSTITVNNANIVPSLFDMGGNAGSVRTIKHDIGQWSAPSSADIANGVTSASNTQIPNFSRVISGGLSFSTRTGLSDAAKLHGTYLHSTSATVLKFAIPLYSGLLGVLMPEKKMIPMSYLPIEAEFTLNPHAFYCVGDAASRNYTIKKMEIHSHVVTFEHDVALQMDSVVARQGLYIPFESFFQSASTVSSQGAGSTESSLTIPINAHFKSITSLHFVCIPSQYETNVRQKKLQFCSCKLTSLQVRNGINYIPSLPITGDVGNGYNGSHVLFYQEMLKSWNRLHDSATPIPIDHILFQSNNYVKEITSTNATTGNVVTAQAIYPNSQYGISFLGEELGKDQSTITGKRGLTPFDLEISFTKPKFMDMDTSSMSSTLDTANDAVSVYFIPYVRADFVLYIRPDLVVQILGK